MSALAQTPRFEVATLKLSPPPVGDSISINLGTVQNGKVTLSNANLSDCLRFAYSLASDEQLAGPDWIKSKTLRFDMAGQAPAGTPREELLAMLQDLLTERLAIRMHREPKELRYLALTVAKTGSKLRLADAAGPSRSPSIPGRIAGNQMPMSVLAALLSRFEHQVVVNRTGLTGLYDFKLEWTPEDRPVDNAAAPSLFTAVQQQLGLKLESVKGPLDILTIDSAEKTPAEN